VSFQIQNPFQNHIYKGTTDDSGILIYVAIDAEQVQGPGSVLLALGQKSHSWLTSLVYHHMRGKEFGRMQFAQTGFAEVDLAVTAVKCGRLLLYVTRTNEDSDSSISQRRPMMQMNVSDVMEDSQISHVPHSKHMTGPFFWCTT